MSSSGSQHRDCLVPDCSVKLEKRTASAYSWRYRVCTTHLNASKVQLKGEYLFSALLHRGATHLRPPTPGGATVRFCQKCSSWCAGPVGIGQGGPAGHLSPQVSSCPACDFPTCTYSPYP